MTHTESFFRSAVPIRLHFQCRRSSACPFCALVVCTLFKVNVQRNGATNALALHNYAALCKVPDRN